MSGKLIRFFCVAAILLHCLGVTQLLSSYAKDTGAFISMLNMTEEETKKEKADSEFEELGSEARIKQVLFNFSLTNHPTQLYQHNAKESIPLQFSADSPTPPPDFYCI